MKRTFLMKFVDGLIAMFFMIVVVAGVESVQAKPDKYTICHVEDLIEMDIDGNPVLDDDGEETIIGTITELKTLPANAVRAHDKHEADHLPDLYLVAPSVIDEGSGTVISAAVTVTACEAPLDLDGNPLELLALGSTDLVEALGIPERVKGGKKDKASASRASNGSDPGANNDDLSTPADIIHPNIHQNNGPGNAACPGDQDHCGNMHGIANNPGQSDNEPGVANLANVHGGIGSKNKNVD